MTVLSALPTLFSRQKVSICNEYFAALFKNYKLINEFRKNSQGMTSDTWNLKYPQVEQSRFICRKVAEQEKGSLYARYPRQKNRSTRQRLSNSSRSIKEVSCLYFSVQKTIPYYSSETWEEVSLGDVASGFEYGMNAAATELRRVS